MDTYTRLFYIDYSDVQENNKVSNVGFLRYMQRIAILHSEKIGYGINELSKKDVAWIVLGWKLKVFERPKFGEKVTVKTWNRGSDKIYFYRDFEIYNEENKLIAIGTSKWIWINLKERIIKNVPDEVREKYKNSEEIAIPEFKFKKIKMSEEVLNSFEYKILRRDIDTNHHVNNLNYLSFAYEVLPEEVYKNIDFKDIEIQYKKELRLNDEILCIYSVENNNHIITIKNKNTSEINSVIKLSND